MDRRHFRARIRKHFREAARREGGFGRRELRRYVRSQVRVAYNHGSYNGQSLAFIAARKGA